MHGKVKVDSTVVDPMEVFMAMSASLMDKQPVPFNPAYIIKPSVVQKLKIGGKPPREVFYRDTLTFMTKLPPAVQPKLCTCKYLCSGSPAAIICHSCSIYDPTRAAYYCDKCFLSRHPWHRVPHMYTTIENDESISHTLKIAHRVAEASRYENEGKGILHRLQKEKPKLKYVADDEKLDDQMRLYGRKVTALEEQVQQMRERLQNDIMHGDDLRRKSLYSREKIEDEPASEMEFEPLLGIENGSAVDISRAEPTQRAPQKAPQKLVDLRNSPFFESEPLFSDLQEGEEGFLSLPSYAVSVAPPANQQSGPSSMHAVLPSRKPMFVRADSTDSTGSMTLSPMDEQVGFFRGDSGIGMGLMRSSLNMIDEGGSGSEKNSLSFPGISETNDGNELNEESDSLGSLKQRTLRTTEDQKMKTVLSGISFTSVVHSDLDSVHSAHSHNSGNSGISTVGYDQGHVNSNVSSLSSSSVCIQRVFKGYLTRRTVSKMLTTRLVKVFSLEAGRGNINYHICTHLFPCKLTVYVWNILLYTTYCSCRLLL